MEQKFTEHAHVEVRKRLKLLESKSSVSKPSAAKGRRLNQTVRPVNGTTEPTGVLELAESVLVAWKVTSLTNFHHFIR